MNSEQLDESKHTQNKVSDGLVIKQRPRQTSFVENLDAANRECIDVHGRAELAVTSCHQLWCLPPESSICAG